MTSPRYSITIARAPLSARFEIVGHVRLLVEALNIAGLPAPTSPSGIARGACGAQIAWIGPRRMTITASLAEQSRLGTELRAAVPAGAAVAVADVTGATVTFVLNGNGLDAVLAQGFAHDVASSTIVPDRLLATDGWGTAAILERHDSGVAITVDASIGDYVEHMLRTAAGLPRSSLPGVMSAPPPPIRVAE